MVALRSRRLEAVFGSRLEALSPDNVRSLVPAGVQEAFDLDFKQALYGRGDSDRRALAGDVAALANTAGGIIIVGIEEDDQARASAAPGVEVTDAEVARIRQVVASLVAPMPLLDIVTVLEPGNAHLPAPTVSNQPGENAIATPDPPSERGFILIAVPRSPRAPHAVLINDALRYPVRNGATTRYLSEPEVAAAYRQRMAAEADQVQRIATVEDEAIERLNRDHPWLVVTLVPDLPGDLIITQALHQAFWQEMNFAPATILGSSSNYQRVSVGSQRLIADGSSGGGFAVDWVLLEAYTDGAGAYALQLPDLGDNSRPPGVPVTQMVSEEALAVGLLSGLLQLATHARDRTAAGGNALLRTQLLPSLNAASITIGHARGQRFSQSRGRGAPNGRAITASTVADLDDLAQPGPPLITAASILADSLGQAVGIPQLGQLSRSGELRRWSWNRDWFQQLLLPWAQTHGIAISDEMV